MKICSNQIWCQQDLEAHCYLGVLPIKRVWQIQKSQSHKEHKWWGEARSHKMETKHLKAQPSKGLTLPVNMPAGLTPLSY